MAISGISVTGCSVNRHTQACMCDSVRLGEEDVAEQMSVTDLATVLSSQSVNKMKPPQLFSLVGAQTMHLTDYCIYYCLCICTNKVILLHFNLFFQFTFCDRGGTSAGSPAMPSCLLDLSLFYTRLSSGFRGEQISFKAANAPVSAITAVHCCCC